MPNWLAPSGLLARYPRKWLLLGAAVLLLAAGAGLFWLIGHIPSTSAFKVVVANNTAEPVVVGHCAGEQAMCDVTDSQVRLAPGAQFTTVTAVGAANPFVLHTPSKQLIGCLTLAFGHEPQGTPTVFASEAGWCGDLLSQ
jgi:hypothetical protein